ncbi:hypothetical protein POPTR_017G125300v4 [Populus trichocarpa]|uniref:DUF7054 domain-containing protein n=1 Tax=Populus trichocarpa TaxID=3694 RepID=A0A2K1X727_POPTR|nr:uncharacterized protein LOC18099384 isoform X1 [Populus trichocarpa]PNS96580.1 hypothetical protein POPTR_017G125300v4 [Populus trichocarpa]|eukprot:XP_006383328.2 uncharacterized protein LOC18099384 isoform X1 [Populus trichocarpa]
MEKSKRNVSEKMLLQKQNKNNKKGDDKKNRFLISISFLGSAGPIRVVVNGDDLVSGIISTALKIYAREGRLPVLGFDASNFLLYCVNAASDALNPWEPIGSHEGRNFVLCKKQVQQETTEVRAEIIAKKPSGWKAWIMAQQVLKF